MSCSSVPAHSASRCRGDPRCRPSADIANGLCLWPDQSNCRAPRVSDSLFQAARLHGSMPPADVLLRSCRKGTNTIPLQARATIPPDSPLRPRRTSRQWNHSPPQNARDSPPRSPWRYPPADRNNTRTLPWPSSSFGDGGDGLRSSSARDNYNPQGRSPLRTYPEILAGMPRAWGG